MGDSEEKNIKMKETKTFKIRLGYFLQHSKAVNEHLKIKRAKIYSEKLFQWAVCLAAFFRGGNVGNYCNSKEL